jgi:hypothetical protein
MGYFPWKVQEDNKTIHWYFYLIPTELFATFHLQKIIVDQVFKVHDQSVHPPQNPLSNSNLCLGLYKLCYHKEWFVSKCYTSYIHSPKLNRYKAASSTSFVQDCAVSYLAYHLTIDRPEAWPPPSLDLLHQPCPTRRPWYIFLAPSVSTFNWADF